MLKPIQLVLFFLVSFFSVINTTQADEQDQWQQFRAQKGISELDAQFEQPKAEPEVRVEVQVVEKIVEVEKIIIKEVPVLVPVEPVVVAKVETPEPVISPQADSGVTVESDGFVFKLSACQMTRRNVKCSLSILSVERDGDLILYSAASKLFDRNVNEYGASKVSMGNKSSANQIRNQYITDVTAKGSLYFENVDKSTQSIALVNLTYHDYGDGRGKNIKFRNVSLSL